MLSSVNFLRIDSIDGIPERDSFTRMNWKSKLYFTIEKFEPGNGKKFKSYHISSAGLSPSESESIRICIENFLNGHYDGYRVKECFHSSCEEDLINIHHVDLNGMPEPFYSMFLSLFNKDSWRIPQKRIEQ